MTLTELQAMSDDEIRVRVAEVMGWRSRKESWPSKPYERIGWCPPDREDTWLSNPANYPASLSACAEFEWGLTDEEHKQFRIHLWTITGGGQEYEHDTPQQRRRFVSASARHRCEAFLMTKGVQP